MVRFLSVYIPALIGRSVGGVGVMGFAATCTVLIGVSALEVGPLLSDTIGAQVAAFASMGFTERLTFCLAMFFAGVIALPLLFALCIPIIMLVSSCVGIIVMPVLVARETMNTLRNPQEECHE